MTWFHQSNNRPPQIDFNNFLTEALCTFKVIWTTRNQVIHGSSPISIQEAVSSIHRQFHDHTTVHRTPMNEIEILSETHTEGWTICTTDVSIGYAQSYGSAVLRDHRHRLLGIATTRFSATNPTLVESLMMVKTAEIAISLNYRKVLFLCDN